MNVDNNYIYLKTKQDYQNLLLDILKPIFSYLDANCSTIDLPNYYSASYSDSVMKYETFARVLWGLSFIDSKSEDIIRIKQIAFRMIANGVNPDSELYWGKVNDFDQRFVEMTPIIMFCYVNKKMFFESFNQKEIDNFQSWFYQINKKKLSENNWLFFIVLVNLFLKKIGLKYSRDCVNWAFKKIDKMYLGNGWYSDGISEQRDYYVSFAIHYYSLIFVHYSDENIYKQKFLRRANLFSKTFIYWFSENGSSLPFGRSLTYKFAQIAFWSAMVGLKSDYFKINEIKGIINRNLRWWLKQKIFDGNGILTLGYAYPNHTFTEYYNATGSSYWALKSFVFLLLDSKHDFFNCDEWSLPTLKSEMHIPEAHMIIERYKGEVAAFVNGQNSVNNFGHTECKYEKFVYSTLFGFNISKSSVGIENLACDSSVAISYDDIHYFSRHKTTVIECDKNIQGSVWIPSSGININSYILPGLPWHLRIHKIVTDKMIFFVDCGFSVEVSDKCENSYVTSDCMAMINGGKMSSLIYSINGNGYPEIINSVPNVNVLYPKCKIPILKWELKPGKYYIVDAVYGSSEVINDHKILLETMPRVKIYPKYVEVNGERYKIDLSKEYHEPVQILTHIKKIVKFSKLIKIMFH